jgi:hypothetical protein
MRLDRFFKYNCSNGDIINNNVNENENNKHHHDPLVLKYNKKLEYAKL